MPQRGNIRQKSIYFVCVQECSIFLFVPFSLIIDVLSFSVLCFVFRYSVGNRISVVFRVRSAKAVKITDATLLKRLGIICLCVGIGLLVRTIVAPPVVIVGRTADDLKAYLCKADWWDHTFTTSKFFFIFFYFKPNKKQNTNS